jgi:tRNA threonylcarbamoyl adenosine modification protein YjeE
MTSMPDHHPSLVVHVPDEEALGRLAARVAAALPQRAFVALEGDLGAGKTTFVKHVAAASGIDPADVVSPTFGLIHAHEGPHGRLVHADFYRLSSDAELRETGWEDALAGEPGRGCHVFVEWPRRISAELPAERLDLAITIDSETGRTLTFTAHGTAHEPFIKALEARPRA